MIGAIFVLSVLSGPVIVCAIFLISDWVERRRLVGSEDVS
jgi:hypothetical protein